MRACCADRRCFLVGGVLAAALAGCSENATTGRRQFAVVPDEALARMADQAFAQLIAEMPLSRDPALAARLERVGRPIVTAAAREDLDWAFVVFERPELNAFVLPNGKVGVTRGMLEFATSDDELGAVLGHEAAHILARHPAERVSQQLAAQAGVTLGAMVFGGEDGENAELVAAALGVGATLGVLLPYSRNHELEADRLGLDLMRKAGLEPAGAVRFWERMAARGAESGQPPEALSTHPADARRLAELKAAVAAVG